MTALKKLLCLLVCLAIIGPTEASADWIKDSLEEYAVKADKSRSKFPDFNGRDRKYREYRTRIRERLKEQRYPNFAGHYNLIDIGLTGGAALAVVDGKTGRVKFSDVVGGGPYWDMAFDVGSRLLIMQWSNGEQCQIGRYLWGGSTFDELDVKEDLTDSEGYCANEISNGKR